MSIVDKQTFAEELRNNLSDKLTLKDIETVTDVLASQMANYEVERRQDNASQQDFDDMLKIFTDTKRIEGRSEKTLDRYRYILGKFRALDKTPIRQITVFNIRQFMAHEKSRGLSDRTLTGYRDVFSSFFGWVHREGLLPNNPCANLMPIKYRKEVRKPYSEVDIEKLKEACKLTRDKAIITFLLSTGCRISEVCNLNRNDIDFNNLECVVLGKGNKERTVYLNEVAAMQLKNYLATRNDNMEALFVGKGSDRLQPHGIRIMLKRIEERSGVDNVHPHRFRRTLATNLINHGMAIQEVAAILGHDRIDTTMTYVYIDKINVKNSYRKYT